LGEGIGGTKKEEEGKQDRKGEKKKKRGEENRATTEKKTEVEEKRKERAETQKNRVRLRVLLRLREKKKQRYQERERRLIVVYPVSPKSSLQNSKSLEKLLTTQEGGFSSGHQRQRKGRNYLSICTSF